MSLVKDDINYSPFWRGKGPRGKGRFCTRASVKEAKLRGDEIRPKAKVFDVVLTGDHDIRDDEQDFRGVDGSSAGSLTSSI